MRILILFAHPAFQKSHVNAELLRGLDKKEGISVNDLYEKYPDFDIDIKAEQDLLLEHDCIVFQFPLFWYSTPSILKEWQDLVLEHGWAYGSDGSALQDKLFFAAISTGGPEEAYRLSGQHHHSIHELLAPIRQTFAFCRMKYLPPFMVFGSFGLEKEDILAHRENYHQLLELIAQDRFSYEELASLENMNQYLKEL